MKKQISTFILSLGLFISCTLNAQVRIDSSFAFGTNPAKKYSIYIPSAYNPANANEMMVGFHPLNTMRWDAQSWCDTLIDFSEANDLLLVCPDGDADGRVTDSIDYAFTLALMDSMKVWFNVDARRTYAFGFSFGGRAVYEFGLDHAEMFGGFMSLGVASSGWNINSLSLGNAAGRPFYLMQGANDPNNAFVPLIAALENHCALLDSHLLTGVGHTIDFTNRNQQLTTAYKWIDSVNLKPISGVFSLTSPLHFATIDITGFHEYLQKFTWTESNVADSCGSTKYEVLIDLINKQFVNPIGKWSSDKGGVDTIFTVRNMDVDSFLANLGVPKGGFTDLKWTVRSTINNHWSDTAKAFRFRVYRKKLGFDILSPGNNAFISLNKGNSNSFDWEDLNHYISVKYQMLMDDTTGSFTAPLQSYASNSNGKNSSVGLQHERLFYDFMFKDEVAVGDSVLLRWTAHAADTFYDEFAETERLVTLIRGDIGMRIRTPQDSSILTSRADLNYKFTWDSVLLSDITYEWYFDTLGVDLHDTASVIINTGNQAHLNAPFELMDSLMIKYQVDYLDTLVGQWTIKALYDTGGQYAMNTFDVVIVRAHPLGIEVLDGENIFEIYPNPAQDHVVLNWSEDRQPERISVTDISGRLIEIFRPQPQTNKMEISVENWVSGKYIFTFISKAGNTSKAVLVR